MNPVIVRNVKIGEGMPKICVPIVGKTEKEILQAAREVLDVPADLVEWRVDWFEHVFETEEVLKISAELRNILGEMPILFTFRTKAEGGEREITFEQYSKLLKEVVGTQLIDLVDVEVFIDDCVTPLISVIRDLGVKVVGSNHDFEKTPSQEEIVRRLCKMQDAGVDIPKIAVMPHSKKDVLALLGATEEMVSEHADRPIITMSMAGIGTVSRISGEVFGSSVSFGTVKKSSAPGQIDVHELKNVLEIIHRARQQ